MGDMRGMRRRLVDGRYETVCIEMNLGVGLREAKEDGTQKRTIKEY